MEVTNTKERNSSVVMSAHDSIAVTIDSSAELMHVLSSSLYVNPRYAMVRETMCNAQDAQIEAGTTHIPIKVTLNQSVLTIQDSGLGIPHNRMGEVYGTFGKSTRKNNAGVTGGHGLGCKSPWSYSDVFTVISCHDGVKTIYKMMKHDPEQDNKMGIKTVMQIPTEESGLTVTVNLKEDDFQVISTALHEVVKYGEMHVLLNDSQIMDTYAFSKAHKGLSFIPCTSSDVCIRYGSVIYPLNTRNDDIADSFYKLASLVNHDLSGRSLSLVLQADPDTLSVAPSRDNLTFDPVTTIAVNKLLNRAYLILTGIDKIPEQVSQIRKILQPCEKSHELLGYGFDRHLLREVLRQNAHYIRKEHYLTYSEICSVMGIKHTNPKFLNVATREIYKSNVNLPKPNKKLYRSIGYLDSHAERCAWFNRYIYYPLMKITDQLDKRCYVRAFIPGMSSLFSPPSMRRVLHSYTSSELFPFVKKRVVITTKATGILNRLPNGVSPKGLLVLVVPREKANAVKAQALLEKQHYTVINLALDVDIPEFNERQAELKEARKLPKVPKKPLDLSFPTVKGCYHYGSIEYNRGIKEGPYTANPVAYVTTGKSLKDNTYTELNSYMRSGLFEYLGDRIAVIRTIAQLKAVTEAGIPPVMSYLENTLFPSFVANKASEIKEHIKAHLFINECTELAYKHKQSRRHAFEDQSNVLKVLGYVIAPSREVEAVTVLIDAFEKIKGDDHTEEFVKLLAKFRKLQQVSLTKTVFERLSTIFSNPLFACINLGELDTLLRDSDPNSLLHKNAVKLTKTLLQGYDND